MTEQIKNTERDCGNCIFHYDLSLVGCRLWECKGTVTIEDVEKAIRSLQAWEEVLQELESKQKSIHDCNLDIEDDLYLGEVIGIVSAIEVIKQKLAEIEEGEEDGSNKM